MKTATILEQQSGAFSLEYDNNLGQKNRMRLDAVTYDRALHEARAFLEIQPDDHDPDGSLWEIE